MAVVDRLFVYPIKSCAGIELDVAELDDFGIRHDRRWMVVDPTGRFITQREIPRMALVRPEIGEHGLTVHAPDMEPLRLTTPGGGSHPPVRVWEDRVAAVWVNGDAAAWFSAALGTPCRPVFMPAESFRPAGPQYAGRARVSFADAFPFLVVSREAVALVSERAGMHLSIRRFRPNLVVSGVTPHAEDDWRRVRVGEVPFAVVKPCSRCVVTTIDPDTGIRGLEPLRTLATYRKRNGKVCFGQNAVHQGRGPIRRGDPITVLDPSHVP